MAKAAPTQQELQDHLTREAARLGVVGAAVGIRHDGREDYAVHGVTNAEHPLPVDEDTLFMIGSTGKLLTATAVVRLVEQGSIELDAPVRTYVPGLKLKDEAVARAVTVLQLLNHTSGFDGDFFEDTGAGDDALERYVELLDTLEQATPLGATVSYNNAAVCLAGRVVETVTGSTFENAVRDLVLNPLGLEHSSYDPNEIMTRRFAASHSVHDDGSVVVMRPWGEPRSSNPAGANISMSVRDLMAFARFHMGDGTGADGSQVMKPETLARMREPTVSLSGTSLDGDALGIAWWLRDRVGVQTAEHGGDSPGQHCEFHIAPERDFALAAMANSSANGSRLVTEVARWAFEAYLGVVEPEPSRLELSPQALEEYAGAYETIAARVRVTVEGPSLRLALEVKPEIAAQFGDQAEEMLAQLPPPMTAAMIEPEDRFVVTDGPAAEMKGAFVRDGSGRVEALHFGGRYAARTE